MQNSSVSAAWYSYFLLFADSKTLYGPVFALAVLLLILLTAAGAYIGGEKIAYDKQPDYSLRSNRYIRRNNLAMMYMQPTVQGNIGLSDLVMRLSGKQGAGISAYSCNFRAVVAYACTGSLLCISDLYGNRGLPQFLYGKHLCLFPYPRTDSMVSGRNNRSGRRCAAVSGHSCSDRGSNGPRLCTPFI